MNDDEEFDPEEELWQWPSDLWPQSWLMITRAKNNDGTWVLELWKMRGFHTHANRQNWAQEL